MKPIEVKSRGSSIGKFGGTPGAPLTAVNTDAAVTVPAASVILENVVAFEVACALVDKFGGDSLDEMKGRYDLFMKMARER